MGKRLVVFIVSFAMGLGALAQPVRHWFAQKALCYPGSAVVVYVNGVNKPSEMEVMIDALDLHAKLKRFNIYTGDVQALYNGSEVVWKDIVYEAFPQSIADDAEAFARAIEPFAWLMFGLRPPQGDTDSVRLVQLRARMAAKLYDSLLAPDGVAMLDQFTRDIQTTLDASNKVVIVAHSQGNFIANALHNRIVAANPPWIVKGLSVVNIATPSVAVPSNLHLTSSSDLVINLLTTVRAPNNLLVDPAASDALDLTGHGFVEIYLSESLQSITDGRSVMRVTLDKVASALAQGEDVPRCCSGRFDGGLPGNVYQRSTLNWLVTASENLGTFVSGNVQADFAVDTLAGPGWSISGTGIASSGLGINQIEIQVAEQLAFRPGSYVGAATGSFVRLGVPSALRGYDDISFALNATSDIRVEVTQARPICIDYNFPSDLTTNRYDRTDAPWASVWSHVAGRAVWTQRSTERAACAGKPQQCLRDLQPYDGGRLDFEFEPVLTPVRVLPSTVQF